MISDVFLGTSTNLIASLIGFILGFALQRAVTRFRQRRIRRLWSPFFGGRMEVVLGRFLEFEAFEPSGFVGMGDALALSELSAFCKTLGFHDLHVSYADTMSGDALRSNLILLGGPDVNRITDAALARIDSDLALGDADQYEVFIKDRATEKVYAPRINKRLETIERDLCLIVLAANPFSPSHRIMIISGSFGFGTWGGAREVTSPNFINNPLMRHNISLEVLLEIDVVLQTPQASRYIVMRELSPS